VVSSCQRLSRASMLLLLQQVEDVDERDKTLRCTGRPRPTSCALPAWAYAFFHRFRAVSSELIKALSWNGLVKKATAPNFSARDLAASVG